MKTLNIQIEDVFYEKVLELLKTVPENKIKIQLITKQDEMEFEDAMDYVLNKNHELYKRLS